MEDPILRLFETPEPLDEAGGWLVLAKRGRVPCVRELFRPDARVAVVALDGSGQGSEGDLAFARAALAGNGWTLGVVSRCHGDAMDFARTACGLPLRPLRFGRRGGVGAVEGRGARP